MLVELSAVADVVVESANTHVVLKSIKPKVIGKRLSLFEDIGHISHAPVLTLEPACVSQFVPAVDLE